MSDSDLYTGVQPADAGVFGNEAEPKEQIEERARARNEAAKLLPSIDVLREIIKGRREATSDIRSYLTSLKDPSGEDVLAEYRARELHLTFLDELESEIENRLANYQEQTK